MNILMNICLVYVYIELNDRDHDENYRNIRNIELIKFSIKKNTLNNKIGSFSLISIK